MHMPNDYLSDVWSAIAVSSKMWTLIDPPFSRPTVNRLSICISIVPYIELSIYRGWQEVTENPP